MKPIFATVGDLILRCGTPPEDEKLREEWEREWLIYIALPFPMKLVWDKKTFVTRARVNKLVAESLKQIFDQMLGRGIKPLIKDFGGIYCYRPQRNGKKLSAHSWGVALDINCDDNPFQQLPHQPQALIDLFDEFGWVWGGRWGLDALGQLKPNGRCDPMHWQAYGYA